MLRYCDTNKRPPTTLLPQHQTTRPPDHHTTIPMHPDTLSPLPQLRVTRRARVLESNVGGGDLGASLRNVQVGCDAGGRGPPKIPKPGPNNNTDVAKETSAPRCVTSRWGAGGGGVGSPKDNAVCDADRLPLGPTPNPNPNSNTPFPQRPGAMRWGWLANRQCRRPNLSPTQSS